MNKSQNHGNVITIICYQKNPVHTRTCAVNIKCGHVTYKVDKSRNIRRTYTSHSEVRIVFSR